jgi:hypothetical protein
MAVVQRYYGLNYGELPKTGAGQQPITSAVSTTSKHIEVRINMGDAAGTTAEIAAFNFHKDRANVIAHLQAIIDELDTETPWPPART